MKDEYIDNLRYIACKIRDEFSKFGYSEETITDMLVEYLYKREKRYKQILWFCYGQYIVNNLVKNAESDEAIREDVDIRKTKFVQCIGCDEWIEVDINDTRSHRCHTCEEIHRKEWKREYQRNLMQKRRKEKC